jgi:hypothetical protein
MNKSFHVKENTDFYWSSSVSEVTCSFYPNSEQLIDIIQYLTDYAEFCQFDPKDLEWTFYQLPSQNWLAPCVLIYMTMHKHKRKYDDLYIRSTPRCSSKED